MIQEFFYGKGLDTHCPLGPCIVTRRALPDPGHLTIGLRVNGEVRQHNTRANMIFDVPTTIAAVSAGMTLEPGDVIAMGTPGGCPCAMMPPRFLQPGDLVEAELESIGALRNAVCAHTPAVTGTPTVGTRKEVP